MIDIIRHFAWANAICSQNFIYTIVYIYQFRNLKVKLDLQELAKISAVLLYFGLSGYLNLRMLELKGCHCVIK